MSWLNDLAGKAESLLNNMDQSAAVAISNSNETTPIKSYSSSKVSKTPAALTLNETTLNKLTTPNGKSANRLLPIDKNVEAEQELTQPTAARLHTSHHKSAPSMQVKRNKNKKTSDENLFKFLNSADVKSPTSPDIDREKMNRNVEVVKVTPATTASDPKINDTTKLKHENQLLRNEIFAMHQELSQSRNHYKRQLEEAESTKESVAEKFRILEDQYGKLQNENESEIEMKMAKQSEENEKLRLKIVHMQQVEENEKRKLDEEKKKNKSLGKETDKIKIEIQDYKNKAARILQSKERLILSLKSGMTSQSPDELAFDDTEVKILEEELQTVTMKNEKLQLDLQNLELEFEEKDVLLHEEEAKLMELMEEKQSVERELQDEINRKLEDYLQLKGEFSTFRANHSNKIQEKQQEIDKLRKQLVMKVQNTPQESELEGRLRHLTERLIEKQSLIEHLHTEKNSFQLQMERMQGQIQRLSAEHGRHVSIGVDSHAEYGRMTKNAVSVVDKMSVRVGVFLKRYPVARLFIVFYMILLHLLVFLVLLTYQPEIHDEETLQLSRRHP